ncbi:hypothetical protein BC834DRAFT_950148 [Gloeopeniophorella convolvens]|nr:hypothetical protein BC834DRAFT_950148 [Gloeopeniophorella convolvens]
MTSTPRSIDSSRSIPPWRLSTKKRAPTSLSFVVATPEAGAPLASAVAHLPLVTMASDTDVKSRSASSDNPVTQTEAVTGPHESNDTSPPDPTQPAISSSPTDDTNPTPPSDLLTTKSFSGVPSTSPAPQPRSWLASLSRRNSSKVPLNDLAAQAPPLPACERATAVEPTLSIQPATAVQPSPELPDPAPASEQVSNPSPAQAETNVENKTIPSKRSWFSSSTSTSGRPSSQRQPTAKDAATTQDTPIPPTALLPVTNIIPPTPPRPEPPQAESRASSEMIPPPVQVTRKWFSPASSFQSKPSGVEIRSTSPPVPVPVVPSPLTPCSIDDQVPKLSPADSTPVPAAPPALLSNDINQNLASLNPSTSRFSLSIPFLGRPKVPLERALASAKAADVRTGLDTDGAPSEPSNDTPTIGSEGPSVQAAEPTPATHNSPDGPSSGLSTDDGAVTQGSWWGYVGWGSAPPPTVSQNRDEPAAPTPLDQGQGTVVAETVPEAADPPSPPLPTEEIEPAPVASTGAVQSHGQTWLSPWAWYGQSATASVSSQAKEDAEQVKAQDPAKTEAEFVKEEAIAQQEELNASPVPASQAGPINPIQSSFSSNVTGWASFFSSKSLLAKRITDTEHREENTMEVMDIDDGDEERGRTATLVATSETRTSKELVVQETQVAKAAASIPSPARSPSPSNKPNPKTKPEKKSENLKATKRTSVSPAPSKGSGRASPGGPPPPNLVLPTWEDTFRSGPRATPPRTQESSGASAITKTVRFVSGVLFAKDTGSKDSVKGKARAREHERAFADFGRELPRAWDVLHGQLDADMLRGCKRVVVIGIHGWFPGAVMRTVLGEPTGTSAKFVTMMCQALDVFQEQHGVRFEKVTQIPLEGEGTISRRVDKLYSALTAHTEWTDDVHAADAILVATHSQGSVVSTHLLDRLIHDKHIRTSRASDLLAGASAAVSPGGSSFAAPPPAQRVCCLALCGIHLGPLRYLSSNSLLQPYIQASASSYIMAGYFESAAAKELFEFQNTDSEVSKTYVKALRNVVDHGVKMVYIASLNDQVVPLYSGLFTAATHPLILRALYIDGDAYHSSDFLSNLLVLLLRIMNVGMSDSGLLTHLSEATAGSLNGVGHSTVYEELATYSLAVNYLFMTDDGAQEHPELVVQPFDANTELNDYEIPWALRDLIANERVAHFFSHDFAQLRNAFPEWHPRTAILRDVKRKLQPIQRLGSVVPLSPPPTPVPSPSKL